MKSQKALVVVATIVMTLTIGTGPVFAWHISNTTTGYRDSSGNFVAGTTIPSGAKAVDSATVDPGSGCSGAACGYVTFTLFSNGDCQGTASRSDEVQVASPIASGSSETVYSSGFVVAPGSWSFRATWVFYASGSFQSTKYSCEPFTVLSFSSAPEFPLGMAALVLITLPALLFLRKRQPVASP